MKDEKYVSEFFYSLGSTIFRSKVLLFIISLIVFICSFAGLFRFQYQPFPSPMELAPISSPEYTNWLFLKDNLDQDLKYEKITLMIEAREQNNIRNLLTIEAFKEIVLVDYDFRTFTSTENKTYLDYCRKNLIVFECLYEYNNVLGYFVDEANVNIPPEFLDTDLMDLINLGRNYHLIGDFKKFQQDGKHQNLDKYKSLKIDPNIVFFDTVPANVEWNEDTYSYNLISAPRTYLQYYVLKEKAAQDEFFFNEWETELKSRIEKFEYNNITVSFYSNNLLTTTIKSEYSTVIVYAAVSFLLVLAYTILILYERYMILIPAIMTVIFSIIEGTMYSMLIVGMPIKPYHYPIYFILSGLMFRLVFYIDFAYNEAKSNTTEPEEIISYILGSKGIPILLSIFVTIIGFGVGIIIDIIAIRSIFIILTVSMLALVLNLFILLIPMIGMILTRIKNNEDEKKKKDIKSRGLRLDKKEEIRKKKNMMIEFDHSNYQKAKTTKDKSKSYQMIANVQGDFDCLCTTVKIDSFQSLFKQLHYITVKSVYIKIMILIMLFISLIFFNYGRNNQYSKFEKEMLIDKNSSIYNAYNKYLMTEDKYAYGAFYFTNPLLDYSSVVAQQRLLNIVTKLKLSDHFSGRYYSWYEDLSNSVNESTQRNIENSSSSDGCTYTNDDNQTVPVRSISGLIPPGNFYDCYYYLLPFNYKMQKNISIKPDTEILNSYIEFYYVKPTLYDAPKLMDDLYEVAAMGPVGTTLYSPNFTNEYSIQRNMSIYQRNAYLIFTSILFVLIWFSYRSFQTTFILFCCSIILLWGIYAFMFFCNIHLNAITLTLLIMSLGVTFDYISHFLYEYITYTGNSEEKVEKTLIAMGPVVFHSMTCLFLSTVFAGLSSGYVSVTFWIFWVVTWAWSMIFVLVFFPVLLAVLGPSADMDKAEITLATLDEVELSSEELDWLKVNVKKNEDTRALIYMKHKLETMDTFNDTVSYDEVKVEILRSITTFYEDNQALLMRNFAYKVYKGEEMNEEKYGGDADFYTELKDFVKLYDREHKLDKNNKKNDREDLEDEADEDEEDEDDEEDDEEEEEEDDQKENDQKEKVEKDQKHNKQKPIQPNKEVKQHTVNKRLPKKEETNDSSDESDSDDSRDEKKEDDIKDEVKEEEPIENKKYDKKDTIEEAKKDIVKKDSKKEAAKKDLAKKLIANKSDETKIDAKNEMKQDLKKKKEDSSKLKEEIKEVDDQNIEKLETEKEKEVESVKLEVEN